MALEINLTKINTFHPIPGAQKEDKQAPEQAFFGEPGTRTLKSSWAVIKKAFFN